MPTVSALTPSAPHRPPVRPRRPGFSLGLKLPLFIGTLIAAVLVVNAVFNYREHQRQERVEAGQRLGQVADEMVRTMSRNVSNVGAQVAATGAAPALGAYLQATPARRPGLRGAALAAIRTAIIPPQTVAVELWDSAGSAVLSEGSARAFRNAALDARLMQRAAQSPRPVVGRFRAAGDSEAFAVMVRVTSRGNVVGYLVHWRVLSTAQATPREIAMLIGTSGRILVGNTRDSIWTDLITRASPPPVPATSNSGMLDYMSGAGEMFAAARAIPSTPWRVVVEFPADSVTEPARELIRSTLWVDVLMLLVGLIGGWLVSRRVIRRLARLTDAAESLGTVGVAPTPQEAAAGDEITRLGMAFDAMAHRVVESLAARESSEAQYRGLFESVPLPLYVADLKTLRFLVVNSAMVDQYGYSRAEFAALTVNDIRPPEDIPRLAEALRHLDDAPRSHGEWRHLRKDGSLIEVEVVAHRCLFDGQPALLSLTVDVTDRNRAAVALQRSEERYRALIRESPYGIALSTPDGKLLEVNPALVRMLGYTDPAELVNSSVRDLYVDPLVREEVAADLARSGHCRRDALEWKRRDGRTITTRFSARLVAATRDADAYVEAIIEDVTDRLMLEERFHQSQRMEAIGRLAGGIAHDFNNLLTVIMTTTELLLDGEGSDGAHHAELEDVYRSAQRGADLTRQLLAFSRRQVLSLHPLSVGELVAGTASFLRRLLGEDVRLEVVRAADDDTVRADPTQLEQVLLNLAVNARDAMPHGGRLTIQTAPVDVEAAPGLTADAMASGAYVCITVSDTGEGMAPEVRKHAFEPFFTTKGRDKGTGLGLATVYGIVKQLGGYVWVDSEVGRGTTFKIYLPRVSDAPRQPVPEPSRRDAGRGSETVLIAEDEEAIRSLLVRVLASRGYTVLAGASGEEALHLGTKHQERIDLLVTDVVMAGMSGPQLADELAKLHPETIPLFLSGYTDEAVLKFGVAAGKVAFLQKPFTHNAFLAKVREVLGGSRVVG